MGITFPKLFVYYDLEQVASERQFLMGKSRDSAAQQQQLKSTLPFTTGVILSKLLSALFPWLPCNMGLIIVPRSHGAGIRIT